MSFIPVDQHKIGLSLPPDGTSIDAFDGMPGIAPSYGPYRIEGLDWDNKGLWWADSEGTRAEEKPVKSGNEGTPYQEPGVFYDKYGCPTGEKGLESCGIIPSIEKPVIEGTSNLASSARKFGYGTLAGLAIAGALFFAIKVL